MRIFKINFLLVLFFLMSCTSKNVLSNAEVLQSDENSISLNAFGANPEYSVIYQLLFRGFPSSSQTNPLISTSESEIQQQFPQYFNQFFKGNRYQTFITSSTKNQDGSYRIVVNTKALKLDLEQNSIIRKFGY